MRSTVLNIDENLCLSGEEMESLMQHPAVLAAGLATAEQPELLEQTASATNAVFDALGGYNPLAALVGLLTAVGILAANLEAEADQILARKKFQLIKGGLM